MGPDLQVLMQEAVEQLQLDNNAVAVELFDKILNCNAAFAEANYGKAVAFVRLGDGSSAISALQKVLENQPAHQAAQEMLTQIYFLIADANQYNGNEPGVSLDLKKIDAFHVKDFWIDAKDFVAKYPDMGSTRDLVGIEAMVGQPPLTITVLKDMLLLGKWGLITSPEGETIRESTFYSNISDAIKCIPTVTLKIPESQKKLGDYIPLCGVWSDGFWHWMLEYLPMAVISEEDGYTGKYIISQFAPPFVAESLHLIGIKPERIVTFEGGFWWIERLHLAQRIQGGVTMKHYPGVIKSLRNKVLAGLNIDETPATRKRRIYISRKDAPKGRRITNESELTSLLSKYNFEMAVMEKMSLKEQIKLIASAEAIVAPHGAGMIHCLFMNPGSLIIELFAPGYVNPCMLNVIDVLNHRYQMVVSNFLGDRPYPHGHNIEAHLEVIDLALRDLKRPSH